MGEQSSPPRGWFRQAVVPCSGVDLKPAVPLRHLSLRSLARQVPAGPSRR